MSATSDKLAPLLPVLASASVGDFSKDVPIPETDDEFTEVYVGIQIMLETIREQIAALKQVDQVKTEFLSIAAHQLRTPLSSIKWSSEIISQDPLTSKQSTHLSYITHSTQTLIDLVNSLLDLSRLELGRYVFEPQTVDLKTEIDRLSSEFQPQLHPKHIQYSTDFPTVPVRIDPKVLRTVLQNLLSNSVKYTPAGGRIHLQIQIKPPSIIITVTDTGPGIPPSQHHQVFTKLFRASNINPNEPGSGLGLYLTKTIIDHYHGQIDFTSHPGHGTVFVVTLPLS